MALLKARGIWPCYQPCRPVAVLRPMPPVLLGAAGRADTLRALYYRRLWERWSAAERALALVLAGPPPLRAAKRRAWTLGFGRTNLAEIDHRADPQAVFGAFLDQDERKGIHAVINHRALPLRTNALRNKDVFGARCRAAGLPVPRPIACAEDCRHLESFIAKPAVGSKGRGVLRFVRQPGGGWSASTGDPHIPAAALGGWLADQHAQGRLVQQWLAPHPSIAPISPGALPTLRIVTFRNEAGAPEVTDAALRLSLAASRAADNFNCGNLVAAVSRIDGRLAPALCRVPGGFVEHEDHPATGARIAGRPAPDLDAACALALAAHAVFADHVVIGWDIGVCAGGPVLIEGNWNPGYNVLQLVQRRGLDELRIGALYRHHLARVGAGWAAAAPIQWIS